MAGVVRQAEEEGLTDADTKGPNVIASGLYHFPPSFPIAEVFFLLFFLLNATLVEGGLNKEQRRLLGLLL